MTIFKRMRLPKSVVIGFGVSSLITISLFVVHFYLTGFGVFGDGLGYFAILRSLLFDHNLSVSNEYQYFARTLSRFSGMSRWILDIPQYSKYTVGMGLILAPFFGLGHVLAWVLNLCGFSSVALDGLSWPYEFVYCLGSVIIGIAGLGFGYKACRLYFGRSTSLLATISIWFASPLFYYLAIEPAMSHAIAAALISALLYFSFKLDWLRSRRQAALLGLLLGCATLVRPQEAFFGLVPLILAWKSDRVGPSKYSSVIPVLVIVVVAVGVASIQALVYRICFGGALANPYLTTDAQYSDGVSFHWFAPKILPVLLTGPRALFVWHPITILAVVGLFIFNQNRRVQISVVVALMVQIYLISAWHAWWQGASVGCRMISDCTPIFILGLAALLDRLSQRQRKLAVILLGFLVVWNALLIGQYMTKMFPGDQPVPIRILLGNQTKVVSRVIAVVKGRFS